MSMEPSLIFNWMPAHHSILSKAIPVLKLKQRLRTKCQSIIYEWGLQDAIIDCRRESKRGLMGWSKTFGRKLFLLGTHPKSILECYCCEIFLCIRNYNVTRLLFPLRGCTWFKMVTDGTPNTSDYYNFEWY